MCKYNLRERKMINYNEDKYYDNVIEIENKIVNESYKQSLIKKIREQMRIINIVPEEIKPVVIISIIDLSMEYIRFVGDSENFRLSVKNKIEEFRFEKKMSKYKKKLNKYYLELDSMMEL